MIILFGPLPIIPLTKATDSKKMIICQNYNFLYILWRIAVAIPYGLWVIFTNSLEFARVIKNGLEKIMTWYGPPAYDVISERYENVEFAPPAVTFGVVTHVTDCYHVLEERSVAILFAPIVERSLVFWNKNITLFLTLHPFHMIPKVFQIPVDS